MSERDIQEEMMDAYQFGKTAAPASPRVSEELVSAAVAEAKRIAAYYPINPQYARAVSNWPEICTAIITLAQDAALREAAEKCSAEAEIDMRKMSGARRLGLRAAVEIVRAMMVKP